MAGKNQRPPDEYKEDVDYIWYEGMDSAWPGELGVYLSRNGETGRLEYWDTEKGEWATYPYDESQLKGLADVWEAEPTDATQAEFTDVDDAKEFLEQAGYEVGNQAILGDRRKVTLPDGTSKNLSDAKVIELANTIQELQKSGTSAETLTVPFWDKEKLGRLPIVEYDDGTFEVDWGNPALLAAFKAWLDAEEEGEEFKGFTEEQANAKLAQMGPGYQKYYDSQTDRWFIKQVEKPRKTLPQGQQPVISKGGYDWAWDEETGDYTALVGRTPEKPRRSLDQIMEDYIISGNVDAAIALDTLRDQMDMPRGLTPAQAADLVMQWAGAPDEAREWIDALTSDWNSRRGEGEQVKSPSESLFGATTAAEKNALFPAGNYPSIDMGRGLPSGLGEGTGGLQFPSWLTTTGGLPTGKPQTQAEKEEAEGPMPGQMEGGTIFSPPGFYEPATGKGKSTIPPTGYGPTEQRERQVLGGMGSGERSALLQARIAEIEGLADPTLEDLEEAERLKAELRGLFTTPPTPSGPTLEDEDERMRKSAGLFGATLPYGYKSQEERETEEGPISGQMEGGTITGEPLFGATKEYYRFPQEMVRGQATSQEQFDTERQKAIDAFQQMVRDGALTQAEADEYILRMPPASAEHIAPAGGTKYYPGGLFAPSPWLKTQAPQSQPTPSALWKRGDVAPFERQLFGKQAPLSPQDALQQAWYRKWQKQRQRLFERQPVKTTLFR